MLTSVSAATLVEVLFAALVLAGIGFAVVSALPVADADADEPPFPLPDGTVTPEAVDRARFPLAFRGYRMAEVDEVLERVAEALAARDAEIARLTAPTFELDPEAEWEPERRPELPLEPEAAPAATLRLAEDGFCHRD